MLGAGATTLIVQILGNRIRPVFRCNQKREYTVTRRRSHYPGTAVSGGTGNEPADRVKSPQLSAGACQRKKSDVSRTVERAHGDRIATVAYRRFQPLDVLELRHGGVTTDERPEDASRRSIKRGQLVASPEQFNSVSIHRGTRYFVPLLCGRSTH
jgi:hypothetical protein